MLAVIVAIFAVNSEQTTPEILDASACFMCMSRKQMLQGLVTILGNDVLDEESSAADVIEASKCIECASEKQLLAAILYQLCSGVTISGQD